MAKEALPVEQTLAKAQQAGLRDKKRAEFEKEGTRKISTTWLAAAAVGLATLLVVGGMIVSSSGRSSPNRIAVAGKQDYTLRNVKMVPTKATVANGEVSVPLADLRKNKFLSFTYKKGGIQVRLLALITPSGRLFTANSMCEPCRSYRFHTEPDGTLTCNACGTKWDLETFEGISGGCPNYPPQEFQNSVRDGKIILKESDIRAWKPRTV